MERYIVVGSSVADSETGITWHHRQTPREAHKTAAQLNRLNSARQKGCRRPCSENNRVGINNLPPCRVCWQDINPSTTVS